MSEIALVIANIRLAAKEVGLPRLAKEAGVPYTTLHSFAARGWSNEYLEAIEKLSAAAKRLARS